MKANHEKYFEYHPNVDMFYFTTDGLAFTHKGKAEQHQKTVTGKITDVETAKREKKDNSGKEAKLEKLTKELKKNKELLLNAKKEEKKALELKIEELKLEIKNLK